MPQHDPEVRLASLAKGNAHRIRRSKWKDRLRRQPDADRALRQLLPILRKPPDWARTWKLREVLLAFPKVGMVKWRKLTVLAHLPDNLRVGDMTERQRTAVIEWARNLGRWS